MDGREKREELAARIKAGEKSLLPMLWGGVQRHCNNNGGKIQEHNRAKCFC